VPLRGTEDALKVTWFSVEMVNDKGKCTYYNNFVTDLPIMAGTVAELAACGRARWKIEDETFRPPHKTRSLPLLGTHRQNSTGHAVPIPATLKKGTF
jgi:hypothetical protein